MALQLHEATSDVLAMLVQLPRRDTRGKQPERRPLIRFVPGLSQEDDANQWSLVEVLRRQNSGPDRAA